MDLKRLHIPILALTAFGVAEAAEVTRLLPFQARLTSVNGKAIPDGETVIQIQIFADGTSNTPLWAGELHRVTVNDGLINVVLGTKTTLPLHHPGDKSKSFFGPTVYLQVTPDANGDDKITDADLPLMPRQAIIPVLFAAESAVSHASLDSQKLAGSDWTPIFGVNSPKGSIPGGKIQPLTIGPLQIADGAVIPEKLPIRRLGADAAIGQIAVSDGVTFTAEPVPPPGTPIPVPNLSLKLTTRGGPVRVQLIAAQRGIARLEASAQSEENCSVTIYFIRDGSIIAAFETTRYGTSRINEAVVWEALDDPPKGAHNYHVLIRGESSENLPLRSLTLREIRLVAQEL